MNKINNTHASHFGLTEMGFNDRINRYFWGSYANCRRLAFYTGHEKQYDSDNGKEEMYRTYNGEWASIKQVMKGKFELKIKVSAID